MIRILHVFGGLDRGGAESMVMNIYRNIDRKKIQFDFITHSLNEGDFENEILSMGGRIFRVPKYKGINHFDYIQKWGMFFDENPEYKIIHGHVRSTATIYLNIAKKRGVKTIAHSHSTSSGSGYQALAKNLLQYPIRYTADYLFACSKSAGIWLYGKKNVKKDNFYILNNAIDTKQYIYDENKRKKIRKNLSLENKFVIGHIGRFNHAKNHLFLIERFKEVLDQKKDVVLLLVGDGELKNIILEKIEKMGIQENVILTGVRSDIPDILQAIDIFVFPSLYEGLPVTVIEAQASGAKCIISDEITNEVVLTDLVIQLPLASKVIWTQKIIENICEYNRTNQTEGIVTAKYDINITTEWLQNFYMKA